MVEGFSKRVHVTEAQRFPRIRNVQKVVDRTLEEFKDSLPDLQVVEWNADWEQSNCVRLKIPFEMNEGRWGWWKCGESWVWRGVTPWFKIPLLIVVE